MLTIRRLNDRSLRVRLLLIAVATTALVGLNVRGAAAAAAVLYVDRNNPSCSDTGPGTSTQPFCTIKPAASQATAGQTVQVASGTYPELVTVSNSGAPGSPIVFSAAPGASVTVSGQANGFKLAGKSYVTIQGFTVANTSSYGFYVSSSSSNVIVSGNTVSNIASNGIYVTTLSSNVTVSGNTVSGVNGDGFWANTSSDVTVSGNTISNTTNYGLHVDTSSNVTVSGNDVSFAGQRAVDLIKYGIKLTDTTNSLVSGNVSHDNLVVDNLSYGNGDHGIDDLGSTNQRIISNTVYDNVAAGINVEGSSTGATIENNIAVDNGINSPRTSGNIRVDSTSTTGTTVNYNLVFLSVPDVMYQWGSDKYDSLQAFRAATGMEAHGDQDDPSWVSAASGDFHLLAGSPAIDSADSAVSGETSTDLEGLPRADDPDTHNSGAGVRKYDDRGAYEFQP